MVNQENCHLGAQMNFKEYKEKIISENIDWDEVDELYEDGDVYFEEADWTDDLANLDEKLKHKIVVRNGKRVRKIKCSKKNYRWEPRLKKCVKMSQSEINSRERAQKKAARKRDAIMGRLQVKRKKSLLKRSKIATNAND
jgi:hypothetical protein